MNWLILWIHFWLTVTILMRQPNQIFCHKVKDQNLNLGELMPGKCQCQLTCQPASLSWWHHNPSVHFYFPVKVNSICCSETWFTLTGYLKLSSTVFYLIPNVFFFYFSHLPLPQIVSPSILKSHYPNNSGYIDSDKIETGRQAGKTKPCSTSRKHGWQTR